MLDDVLKFFHLLAGKIAWFLVSTNELHPSYFIEWNTEQRYISEWYPFEADEVQKTIKTN